MYYRHTTDAELERAVNARDFDAVIELVRRFKEDGYVRTANLRDDDFEDTCIDELAKAHERIASLAQQLDEKSDECVSLREQLKAAKNRINQLTKDDEL